MKNSNFKSRGIRLSILLSATTLLILQLSGGGRVTAGDSDEPVTQPVVSCRVTAEHPPVEIVEKRDDHTRIWEIVREIEITRPDGSTTLDTIKSYIHEKASGLCYKDASGAYVPSLAEWRETPDGFVIDRCPYGLTMGKSIGVSARYTVEGNDLLLRPAHLIISDRVNQADLATLNPETRGSISPDNPSMLRFRSAFGEGYDLEYIAEKGGFHQNLIITNPPEIPDDFNPDTASIHLYTEMNLDQYLSASGCEVSVEGELVNTSAADLVTKPSRGDCISFTKDGRLLHAFSVSNVSDSSGPGALDKQTTAEKRLMKDAASGKAYLVESVPFSYFTDSSPTYPITWDYVQKSGAMNQSETWEPRYTYRITGNVAVSATLTILPGTTVKLDPSKKITIASAGKVIAKGEPYNYITFTKSSDNNCGEAIPGAPAGAWSKVFEVLSDSSSGSIVEYCKFGHGSMAIDIRKTLLEDGEYRPIQHNIFNDIGCAIQLQNCSAIIHNNLMTYCSVLGVYSYGAGAVVLTNNTIAHFDYMGIYDFGADSFTAKDNLLSNSQYGTGISSGSGSAVIEHNRFYSVYTHVAGRQNDADETLTANPYQSSALGDFFLNSGGAEFESKLEDKGSGTAEEAGLGEGVFSVLAPEVVPTGIRSGSESYAKIASDTGTVDIGYHHGRVDCYLGDNTNFSGSGASLTISPGVVVGVLGGKYLKASSGGTIRSVGDPAGGGLNVIACSKALSMNIESPQFGDTTGNPYIYLSSGASEASSIQYTRITWLGWGVLIDPGRWLREPIQHNVFSLSYYGIHAGIDSGNVLFNNLFYDNVQAAYAEGDAQERAAVRNCTFDRNTTGLRVYAGSGETLPITDCLFTSNLAEGILINAGAGTIANDYNAYWANTADITGGTWGQNSWSDKEGAPNELTESPYSAAVESGWQLHYRLNQNSPVIDAGSRTAAAAWLDEFTTAPEGQNPTDVKEVDMGFHFPPDPVNLLHGGYRQTDIALRWNNMSFECLRAFSLDGDAHDEMGNEDGLPSNVGYGYLRYRHPGEGDIKYDFNRCAVFNGAGSKVNVGNSNDPDTGIRNLQEFTLTAWVFASKGEAGNNGRIYEKGPVQFYVCEKTSTTAKLKGQLGDDSVTSTATLSLNTWTHVAMTWNGSAIQLYKSGASCSDPGSASQQDDSACDGIIGNDAGGQNGFYGRIADFFIYNRVLELDELKWLAFQYNDRWLVTPNLGAMGEGAPGENQPTRYPVGQMHGADWALQDAAGNIWVNEHGSTRVTKLRPDGAVLATIGGVKGTYEQEGQLWDPYGIALDSDNNVYIVNSGSGGGDPADATRISVYRADATFIGRFGIYGAGDAQLITPYFIAVDAPSVYVSDAGNFRIQKWTVEIEPQFTATFEGWWGRRARVTPAEFTGTGQDDMTSGGRYTGSKRRDYEVWIDATPGQPDPDSFAWRWKDEDEVEWHQGAAGVPIAKELPRTHTLNARVTVTFGRYTGHTGNEQWEFSAEYLDSGWHEGGSEGVGVPRETTHTGANFYEPRGIAIDSGGHVWVCDRGETGNNSYIKKIDPNDPNDPVKSEFSTILENPYRDYTSGLGILKGPPDYIYSSGGGEVGVSDHIAKWTTGGQFLFSFNAPGTGPDEAHSPWGGFPTPGASQKILSTCWFGGKVMEWHPNGAWIKTFWSTLRSDGYTVKCKNHSKYIDAAQQLNEGEDKQVWQRVTLPQEGTYRLQFLAYTTGEPVTIADVIPYARYTGPGQPDNRVSVVSWENFVVTDMADPNESDLYAAYVWGRFTVAAGESALPWDIGVHVEVNEDPTEARLVYISSLSCWKE